MIVIIGTTASKVPSVSLLGSLSKANSVDNGPGSVFINIPVEPCDPPFAWFKLNES